MKRKLPRFLLCLCAALTLLCVYACADSGPKPSVTVTLKGVGDRTWYATLLSSADSTGPYAVFEKYDKVPPEEAAQLEADPAWRAFYHYQDADGYYFLQFRVSGEGDGSVSWTYFPPQRFKLALYFPDSGEYVVSEPVERYAFHSAFAADLRKADGGVVPVVRSWNCGKELWGLLLRVLLTVSIELSIAVPFGYREKRRLRQILRINLATQLLLNAALFAAARFGGVFAAMLLYLPLEIAVFVCEGTFYRARFGGRRRPYLYALTANAASFAVGVLLALRLPEWF